MGEIKKQKKDKKEKAESKSESEISSLSAKMNEMVEGLNTVGSALSKLIELQSVAKVSETKVGLPEAQVAFNPKIDDSTYPTDYVPRKYRDIVNEILSEDFGINVIDFDDRTDFQINIIVPERYSSVSKEDTAKGVMDIRSRMIPRALGENGVREWCSLIRQNLNKYYTNEGKSSPFVN